MSGSDPARRLEGITAIVTGAARGLGRSVAAGFARRGASVHACDRMPIPEIEGVERYEVDLSDRGAATGFVREVLAKAPDVQVLVNNAAVLPITPMESITEEEWDGTFAVNLTAPFLLCREILPTLREHGGSIINVSSRAGVLGMEHEVTYCATKFGIEGLTRALATEAGANVSVNTITPGMRIKPTMMTDEEEAAVPPEQKVWRDAEAIVPAFALLALARGNPTGKRFEADKLSDELKRTGVVK